MNIELKNELSVDEYNELRKSVNWPVKDEDLVSNILKMSLILKKAVVGEETVGMARVFGDGLYYFIADVIVAQRYQNMGIGRKLIDSIVEDIYQRTKEGQSCGITLLSMKDKEPFYEKCGFTKVPFLHTGYGMIRIIHK